MQHVGSHYSTGNTTAFHSMHFTPAAENATTNVSSGPTTTSVLRSWRKKDASEKQPPTTSTPAEPPSGNVTENQGPVARVAPHNHYPKPSPADIYRFPQQHGDYGVQNVSQLPAPVKYSEIIEPMQSIEQIPPLLQKPKEKSYMEMCNVQQNHMKAPYPDYQNYKQHYDGLKNYNHMPSYKQQYHPYLQKESQMPGYVQKEANLPPQYLHNYKMPPTNYPRNYPREGNEFLANLNKIAPDMAQDIINDPHLRDPHLREPQFPMYPPQSMDQNRLYQQQHQRMYQRTSPVQHGVQNYGQRNIPQNFNQYQMNQQRMPPSDPYRMYSPHQRYGQVETQMPTNISPRQYHENMMNFPPRISPNYPSCGQLEYAQHYQPRQVPMRQEFLPIPNKPYIETHPEIPEIVPDESLHQPKKTLKAYLENWREEFTEEVESTEALAADKIQLIKSTVPNRENTLYVLDAMEIPSENIPQYIHLQPIDKLPPNIRAFAYNAEENVRQNAIVISGNMKNDDMQKNETPKDNGTYQLFQNKTEGNTDNRVYQPNVLSAYKSEDILSHEDRPACKLLQSMVKARNANAIEKPIGKQDGIIGDKDQILRSCFQEPQKEICRSLPQLINEDAEELHKNNEEHLENEYSKIVDSILEENTQSVQVLPISETVGNAPAKIGEKKEITKANDHLITTNNNSSINFTENLINSLEIVERKSVIAENTIPHIATENSKQSELQNSYDYFSIPEDNIENSTTICNNDVKSQNQEEKITETANQKLNDEEPPCKDLQILEDPIDLSHHLEEINSMVETNIETSEKDDKRNEENIPDIIERKHVYTDILEYKDAFNLGKDPDIIEEVQAKTVTSNATPEKETYFSDDNRKNEDNPIQNCPVEEFQNRSEDKLGNQEQILSNLEDKNEKIDAENSLNQKIEDSEEQNIKNNTCPDAIEETNNSNLQNCVKDDEFQQKCEESSVGEDIIDTVPQKANLLEDEMQVLNSKDVEIQEEKIFEFTNDISKEEIKKIENPSNEDVICEEITQENINNEENEDKNTNIICDIEEIDDNNSKDENLSTKDQIKTESDTEDIIDEEIQEKLSDIEQLDDIKNEHNEKLNFEDNASPSTIENSDVEESTENIMNVENYEETELNIEDTDASEASEESDEDDNEDYTFEAKSSIIGDVEDGDIVITAKQEDGVEVPSTNEVSLENTRTEENINESKEENISVSKKSKSVPVEESVSQDNHAEEATSHTKISVGVIEEDEIITSNPLVEDLDEKEENNNEIIKETSIKHDDIDDQACEDKKMKEHDGIVDEEKEDSLINALNNEIDELNRISYLRAQEAKINQSNIQEGAKTKEDIGSSFVLEIAKELLQINVMENSNGEKVIAITPLTKVKIITPAEITKECTDKQEETSVQTNNKITENDEFKNEEEEEENEITNNATDELEINEDLLLYENEIEEISETVVTTEETQESDQKAVAVDVIKIEDETEIEEVSETVVTTEDTQDTESEQETATENVIEVEDKTEDNFEENLQNTDHADAIIDHIIEENEILIEECNEIETDLKIEDDEIQQITEDHIIPGSDLDLHNEVIIVENKDETNDEIILDNAQTEIVVDQPEEIFKNGEENKTIQQEDTIFNNNYIKRTSIESHEATKDEKEDKNKEQTNKLSSIQNTNKKVFKSKRTNEKKPVENKKSQLNALRNFRKIKNRNSGNFEINQSKKFVSQSSKKKKNDLSNVEKFKASLDNAERAKIFSSIVVIDKIPLETIKKVTRRIEDKFDDKSKKKIKRYSKIKLKDKKLSKEYKNIKTKFKRQREISRDIKRLMRKSNSFKSIHKNDEKNRSKDNSKDTSAKSIGIRDKTKAQNENSLVVIEKVKQTIPDVVSVTKPISLQADNCSNVLINLDDKPVDCSKSGENSDIGKSSLEKLQCEVKEIRLEDDQNNLKQSFEKLKPKREDQILIKDQKVMQNERENDPRQCFEKSKSKIGDQNSIKEQKLVQNEEASLKNLKVASATQATSSLVVKDQITKPLPNYPTISQTINPNKHPTIVNHTKILPITNIQPIRNQHHFQAPFPKDVHSLVRKHPKELRRTKSDTYFNADFLLNFKKRRLSLEEYNNRKKNLNKLANQKIEAEIKEKNKSSIAIEDNKEKEKMVEEVLKSLKSEEIELSEAGSAKDVPSQIESINDINMKSEDVLNYNPGNPEPVQEKTPNKEITESKLVENVEELLYENIAKNSESIEEKVSIMMSDDPGKPELVENSTKNDDTSVEELIIQEHSVKIIEVQKQEEMLQNESDNNSNINIEPTKDDDIKSNEENKLEMELSPEDKIQGNPEESSMEANTSKVQINSSSEIPQSPDNFQKNLQTDASKPKEHFDKSSIEEKVNSLEEFLPKISPKDPIRIEISRKLEEFLNENPITYDQKHFEMLLIKRFLNRETLTSEELKRVRQIVHYKRAFQSMKKSAINDIPKRRYSSEFPKSIKIDFNDFNLKKSDPAPSVKKEVPVQRKVCYNRSISAFVEAESRRNELRNRRILAAKAGNESQIERLNKEGSDRKISKELESLKQSGEHSLYVKSSVIVENAPKNKTEYAPNSFNEKSILAIAAFSNPESENIEKITNASSNSSPRSKLIINNNIIEISREECKNIKSEPLKMDAKESVEGNLKNILRECDQSKIINKEKVEESITDEKPSETLSNHISTETTQNETEIDSKINEINKIEDVSSGIIPDVKDIDKNQQELQPMPPTVPVDQSKPKDFTRQEDNKPNSLTENASNPLVNMACSSKYIKHTILSIISKDNEATSESSKNRAVDGIRERPPDISAAPKTIKHAIENLISRENTVAKKPSDEMSKITSSFSRSKYTTQNILCKDQTNNLECTEAITLKSPVKVIKHTSRSSTSDDKDLGSANLENSKISVSKLDAKYISPNRSAANPQNINEVIINPSTSAIPKTSKQNETVILDRKEKSLPTPAVPIKNTKEFSQHNIVEEKQKKLPNTEQCSSIKSENFSNRVVVYEGNKKRNFEQSPIRKTSDVNKEKLKIKKFERNQQEIANLERSVSNLTIDKEPKKYPNVTKESSDTNLEKPILASVFNKKENEKNLEGAKMKSLIGNENLNRSPRKIFDENIKYSEMPSTSPKSITNKEYLASPSGSKQSCSSSKTKCDLKEISCQSYQNKTISKTKAQLKSFQDSIEAKPKKEDDQAPDNANISPVISNLNKLTALLTYYKRGLESGASTASLKKIEEIMDKVSPNLRNLPTVPDINIPNEYAIAKPDVENSKLKLHLRKIQGENKKKKKRFRNLYTENDSEEDGCVEPKVKEPKMDGNAIDYSVYQRKSPAGVPKLVIKRRKSDFKSDIQPYVKISRIQSIESMVKKRKRTIFVNQVFVDI